jgi:DNA repair exonuclease SbcCD ATPase subunit
MKIQRVDYKNLKGGTDSVVLGPATLIYGPNFTGKTTIIDAIKLALLGYHPGLDKTAGGVMELASGDELKAAVVLDSGQVVGHVWTRAGGRITKRDSVPLDWPEQPVAVLDAAAYFGLSDRGKVEYLFKVAKVEGTIEQARGLLDTYGPAIGLEIAGKVSVAAPLQKWLDGALTVVEALRSEAAANAKRFQMTQQGTAQLSDFSTPPPIDLPEQIKTKEAELETARSKLRDLERGRAASVREATNAEEVEAAERKLAEITAHKTVVERERTAATEKWRKLLSFKGVCPMCGSDSEAWHKGAEKMRDQELANIARRIEAVTEEIQTKQTLVDNWRKKADRAKARAQKKHATEIEASELTVAELTQSLADLNKQQYRYGEYVAERRRLEAARTEAETAEKRQKAFGGIKLKLLEAKARLLEATFGPILKTVEIFTRGILRQPLEFADGELGYRRNGGWVPYRTFSGTEQAVGFAAFQAALASRAPVPVAILDELGRLDRPNKARLLENVLDALKSGVIHQFIGVDTELTTPKSGPASFLTIERR